MNETLQTAIIIATIALVTAFTRGLPYILFGGKQQTLPAMVRYLGTALPGAIMVILVIYCLRNIQVAAYPYGLPEILAAAAVTGVHLWKKNPFVSILLGTACYMILLRVMG